MGFRKCMECKGKGYVFIEVKNLFLLIGKATPFLRNGKPTEPCKKCKGYGFFGL